LLVYGLAYVFAKCTEAYTDAMYRWLYLSAKSLPRLKPRRWTGTSLAQLRSNGFVLPSIAEISSTYFAMSVLGQANVARR